MGEKRKGWRHKCGVLAFSLMVLLTAMGTAAHAETEAAETEGVELELEEGGDVLFQAIWENQDVEAEGLVLTDPNGICYGTGYSDDRVSSLKGQILVGVPDAAAGTWNVKLIGSGFGRVTISAGVPLSAPTVEAPSLGEETDDQTRTVSWQMTDRDGIIYGEVYADTQKDVYNGQYLTDVTVNVGETHGHVECSVSMKGLETGWYYLYVVAADEAGAYTRFYLDGQVYHEASEGREKVPGVSAWAALTVNEHDPAQNVKSLVLSWDKQENDKNRYKIKVWDRDTKELLLEQQTEGTNAFVTAFPEGKESVLASVAYCDKNGLAGQTDILEVDSTDMPNANITWPEGDFIRWKSAYVKVQCDENSQVTGYLDDEKAGEQTGSGDMEFSLTEGDHRLEIWVRDSDNVIIYGKDYLVDTIPPQLQIYEDVDGMTTAEDHVYIHGYSEPGVTLLCGEKSVEMEQGYFSHRVGLSDGVNEIFLTARDSAGNEMFYSAQVTRKKADFGWNLKIIVICSCAVIGVILFMIIRKRKGLKT